MPPFDRGAYEPGEDVRVYDGSDDDEDVEGSRLPLLIVLALLVLAMFGGVVWLAYTQGVARGRTETPVLTAANGPARVAPANGGGTDQPYKGFKIYEQPAPPDDDTPAASPAAPVPAAAKAPDETPAPAPEKAVAPPAPKAVAAPAPKIPPPPATKPAIIAATPPPAPKPSMAATAPAKAQPLTVGPATAPPRSLASPPPAVAPAPKAAAVQPAPASGSAVLQIGAYKSQAEADAAWKVYKAKHAALLSGYGPDVQQVDLGEKGTWYRLRIAGFPSKDVASALCDRLKADHGPCFLGK
jgi:hypothetical protein